MPESLFNKVAGHRPQACNFIKKRLRHKCFPSNFAKFLRTPPVAASGSLFSQDHQLCQVTSSIYIVHCTGKKFCVYHVRGSHFY